MKIINKLTLGYLFIGLLVMVVAFAGIDTINNINLIFTDVSERNMPIVEAIENVKASGLKMGLSASESVLISAEIKNDEVEFNDTEKEQTRSANKEFDAAISHYEELVNKFDPYDKEILNIVKNRSDKFQNVCNEIIAIKEQGASGKIVLEKWEEFEEAEEKFLESIDVAIAHERVDVSNDIENVKRVISKSVTTIIIAGLFSLALAIMLGVIISKSISDPITRLKNATEDISKGKMDTRVDIKSSDEVGILARGFNRMASDLKQHTDNLDALVTERTLALSESEEKFEGIAATANDAIIMLDNDGKIEYWNDAARKIFGYSKQEMIKEDMHIILAPGKYHNAYRGGFSRSRITGEGAAIGKTLEFEAKRKDGTVFPIELSVSALKLKGKWHSIGILRDITERKKAEEKIAKLNDDLRRHAIELTAVNKELEAFSYSVSHDLRAPLRTIDGFSQALLEDYADKFDEKGKDYLGRVRAASHRMAQIIDDMLKLSRLTRSEMNYEKVDLSAIVTSIRDELRATQPERRVEFIIAQGIIAEGDARLLRVALENLLRNAWKFTGKRSNARIEFGVAQIDGERSYFITDNGAGFDMAYSSKLFGAFQRLHGSTEFPGTGVGLAIVQRIIHRHGGKVWANGEIEKGATFSFTLGSIQNNGGRI